MCRLFGQLSPTARNAADLLTLSACSLLRQSDADKKNLQKDGWGIAWFGNLGAPVVSKSHKPAFKEGALFRKTADLAVSTAVVAHLRAASNPRGVPRSELITFDNTQPFTDGRWVFAHNGTLQIPQEVEGRLGPLRRKLKSHNDSEVYFWEFVKFQRRLKDPAQALRAVIDEVWDVWRECRARYPRKKGPYTSLNCLVSDGKSLTALCHNIRPGQAERGVCNPTQPWQVMSFTRRGERLVVASENLDRGRWTRLVQPEILCARLRGGRLDVRRQRFEVPAS